MQAGDGKRSTKNSSSVGALNISRMDYNFKIALRKSGDFFSALVEWM